ncbi:MAG: ATP-binding protein [Rubrimonas sp.]|uniref:sensor histidine kinase n=1 Tax=Rubrimonas sp. TaxID=2036015 RepID=UPI002FDE4BBC
MRAHVLINLVGALFFALLCLASSLVYAQMDRLEHALAQMRGLMRVEGAAMDVSIAIVDFIREPSEPRRLDILRDAAALAAASRDDADLAREAGPEIAQMEAALAGARAVLSKGIAAAQSCDFVFDAEGLCAAKHRLLQAVVAIRAAVEPVMAAALKGANAAARRTNLTLFAMFIASGAAVAALWSTIASQLLRPLRALTDGFAAIRHGDYAHRIETGSPDGCDHMCEAFNEMARTLETTTASRGALETEIARRAALEEHLRRQNTLLVQSNVELDAFAHIAAHDLRAPLRGVKALTGWLREDLGTLCTPEAQFHLDLLCGRVDRLEALLDALQSYAEIGRIAHSAERVRPDLMVEGLAAEIDPDGRFAIGFEGSGDPFCAHRAPLETALRELLANAVKHHDRKDGRISVRLEADGSRRVFTVTDDGPGVPPDLQERIFEMFQTLRPRDEVEGAGMGLALIRKAARIHGGLLQIESPVSGGRGCAFRLVWPSLPFPDAPA